MILKPAAFKARTADSRPGPGPLIFTSRFFTPDSAADLPATARPRYSRHDDAEKGGLSRAGTFPR